MKKTLTLRGIPGVSVFFRFGQKSGFLMVTFRVKIIADQSFAGYIAAFCTALCLNLLVIAALIRMKQMLVGISCFIRMLAGSVSLRVRRKIIDFPVIGDEIIVSFVEKDGLFRKI